MTIVFIGEGGAQNGRMAECLNAASKEVRASVCLDHVVYARGGGVDECLHPHTTHMTIPIPRQQNLPILFLVIDNGRAINTFTPDVATNSDVWLAGQVR